MTAILGLVAFAVVHPVSNTGDLVGVWEGLSLCADKIDFPTVHDEQVVYHVSTRNGRVLVTMGKVVGGREEPMTDDPLVMVFDAKNSTLRGKVGGRKPSTWTFHVSWSTWDGTAQSQDGSIFRRILVKRR